MVAPASYPDGSVWLGVAALALLALIGVALLALVVAARRSRRRAREQQGALPERLLSVVSHELKTPVATVIGFSELLVRRDLPPQTQRDYAQRILQAGHRLNVVVRDLIDTRHIRHAELSVSPRPVLLAELVGGALEAQRLLSPERCIALEALPGVWVLADPVRIAQVLSNLLSNAVAYSPAGSEVQVGASEDKRMVTVTVCNSSGGVPLTDTEQLFVPFYRSERHAQHHAGLGLGLSVAQGIIRAHHGTIWLESNTRYTTVRFTLPKAPP